MNDRIVLDMTPGEATVVYGKLDKAAVEALRTWEALMRSNAPADEQEAVKVVAAILARVTAGLANLLYPPCRWWQGDCDMAVYEDGYCRFHYNLTRDELADRYTSDELVTIANQSGMGVDRA